MNNPKDNYNNRLEEEVYECTTDTSWLREHNLDVNKPDKNQIRQILKRELNYQP